MNNLIAQNLNLAPTGSFSNLGSTELNLPNVVSTLITLVLIVAAVVFFFMLMLGGIKWILSGGDKAQTESARNQITAALVGLVIVFSAWAIATVISNLFGVSIFDLQLPSFLQPSAG